jgi:hypothetical protein
MMDHWGSRVWTGEAAIATFAPNNLTWTQLSQDWALLCPQHQPSKNQITGQENQVSIFRLKMIMITISSTGLETNPSCQDDLLRCGAGSNKDLKSASFQINMIPLLPKATPL